MKKGKNTKRLEKNGVWSLVEAGYMECNNKHRILNNHAKQNTQDTCEPSECRTVNRKKATMNKVTYSNQIQCREDTVGAGKHSAITAVVLLRNVSLHILQIPLTSLQCAALLIAILVHQILQQRIQHESSRATHRITIADLLLLNIDDCHGPMGLLNNKRSQYIVRVDRDDNAALTKEIHLASPPSNGRIAILRQFLEEEAIEAVNRFANYK